MTNTTKAYWLAQARKHERAANTLRAKWRATGEVRWFKQSRTNENSARVIRNEWSLWGV